MRFLIILQGGGAVARWFAAPLAAGVEQRSLSRWFGRGGRPRSKWKETEIHLANARAGRGKTAERFGPGLALVLL